MVLCRTAAPRRSGAGDGDRRSGVIDRWVKPRGLLMSSLASLLKNRSQLPVGNGHPDAPVARRVRPPGRARQRFKRAVDLAAALFLLPPALPLIVVAMVLVRLTSRGPAVYTQTRVGRGGRPFTIYKIRTMIHECEMQTGVRWS